MIENTPTILSTNEFPVVGIGASAGGLDAFKKVISAIPIESGMAYVLVQHLDPKHESLLAEILQKVTKIPVLEITDEVKVLPDHIYIIPSNRMLTANDGVLLLSQRPEKKHAGINMPIDLFFTSLAEVHQKHAIGIVLSGTGKDGTLGLQTIKAHGGVTIVQDESSAAYKGMPHSAIGAGVADFILMAEAIPDKLRELHEQEISNRNLPAQSPPTNERLYEEILSFLKTKNGNDFKFYKQTTIRRRIARRMAHLKIEKLSNYQAYLLANKNEYEELYLDLLIPVTSFFRDHDIFTIVCKKIFPEILKGKLPGAAIRIWVAGCSTGQEAYSLAICFKELLNENTENVQIFATDISVPAIAKARKAVYSKPEIAGISAERLKKYFTETNGSYLVNKQVRDICVFALHSFIKDPPFSKIDFVSCRNVLIYMEPNLQKKALTTFHYALNPNGFLLLGKSETVSSTPDLFVAVDKKEKLFTRKEAPARFLHVATERNPLPPPILNEKNETMHNDFDKAADEVILKNHMPAGVVVNELLDIVQFRGNTSDFLEQAPGKPTHNLLKLAKTGLGFELRSLILKAKKEKGRVKKDNIALKIQTRHVQISIEVIPLEKMVEPYYLVLFTHTVPERENDVVTTKAGKKNKNAVSDLKDLQIAQLEKQIAQSKEDMRQISEDQEAANEELQSANEEYQSTTEELQSLNEELETSKEELQSSNEELTSLFEQVTTALHYAEEILTTIHVPLLVLDKHLIVKRANLAFYKAFNLLQADTENCLIYDLDNKRWDLPLLHTALDEIFPGKKAISYFQFTINLPSVGERIIQLNATEILREKKVEKLMLLSLNDVTDKVLLDAKQLEFRKELEQTVEQRTMELRMANQTLLENNETLKTINNELEIFNYIASHDLQEPVRKIKTFADMVFEKEQATLSDESKNYMKRMVDAATRLQALIRDLSLYSQAVNKELSFEKVNLNLLLDEVLIDLQENIRLKDAVTDIGPLEDLLVIPFQLRQLFINLISNSLKFSKPGVPPIITIRGETITGSKEIHPLLKEKKYFHINFADNGIGFDQHFEKKVFHIFQQLNKKSDYSGTGIGLSIVKKVIDNHHGVISVKSEPGKGTSFDIYLPVEQ